LLLIGILYLFANITYVLYATAVIILFYRYIFYKRFKKENELFFESFVSFFES
jgi:Flp pilus assembly protein TadB